MESPYASIAEAAAYLRTTPGALRMRILRGQIRAYRPSPRVTLLRWDDLERYVKEKS